MRQPKPLGSEVNIRSCPIPTTMLFPGRLCLRETAKDENRVFGAPTRVPAAGGVTNVCTHAHRFCPAPAGWRSQLRKGLREVAPRGDLSWPLPTHTRSSLGAVCPGTSGPCCWGARILDTSVLRWGRPLWASGYRKGASFCRWLTWGRR